MTPDSEFKKFLIIILLMIGLYYIVNSDCVVKIVREYQSIIFSKIFVDKEITEDTPEQENDIENWFNKTFKKKNPYKYWISGNIKINSLSNYNSVSKEQVYSFRKYYVNKTIFKDRNYTPSEEVFGGISDKHKWLGIRAMSCYGPNSMAYQSMTNDSKFINNPAILVGVEYAQYPDSYFKCSDKIYILPKSLHFSKDDNTFYLTYNLEEVQFDRKFKLVGLNARDLGFKYVFVKKSNNIEFTNLKDNASTNVYEFKDAIRPDASCGVKGGCNNNLAYQEEVIFNILSSPATFELKLWKEKPLNSSQKADINFTITLE